VILARRPFHNLQKMKTKVMLTRLRKVHCSALAALLVASLLFAQKIHAASVDFFFQGIINQVQGPGASNLPPSIVSGAVVSGRISYTSATNVFDPDSSTNFATYTFTPGLLQIQVTVAGHELASDPTRVTTLQVVNDHPYSTPTSDRLTYSADKALLDGLALLGGPESTYFGLDLNTTNLLALATDALPNSAPSLTDFIVGGGSYRNLSFYTYKLGNYYYGFGADIISISPVPKLSISKSSTHAILTWPAIAGFVPYTAPSLSGPWIPVDQMPELANGQNQLTVPMTDGARFFRLQPAQAD
jgi:hypothetical protein